MSKLENVEKMMRVIEELGRGIPKPRQSATGSKYYDYEKAKQYIENCKENGLTRAYLGMQEDWYFTRVCIWPEEERDRFEEIDLDDPSTKLAGINFSTWATPTLVLEYAPHGSDQELSFPCWATPEEHMLQAVAYEHKLRDEEESK